MVENLRKAEFDAAQPVRNKETGKIESCLAFLDTSFITIVRQDIALS
jgi:hypothetical protein